jgi:hypothetical protein
MKMQERTMDDMVGKVDSSNERNGNLFYNRVSEMDTRERMRFEQLENTFKSTFWTQKVWLIALSAILSIFAIVVISR